MGLYAAAPTLSVAEAVVASARRQGDRAALLAWRDTHWQELAFSELARQIDAVAAALGREGLAPGDRVAILGGNSPEWGLAYLSILRAAGVAVPLDRLQTVGEWLDVLTRSGAERIFVAHAEGVRLLPELPRLKAYSLHGDLPGTIASLTDLAGQPARAALPGVSPHDLASLIFTSGTTGKSKGVMLTHANIVANAQGMLSRVDIDVRRDRFLSVLPLSHAYECTCGLIAPLLAGVPVYFARGLAPREIVADLERSGATFLLGVPLLYEKVATAIERGLREAGVRGKVAHLLWEVSSKGRPIWKHRFGKLTLKGVRKKAGLGQIRYLVSGGAALSPSVGKRLTALGVPVLQGYGLTETSPVVTLNPPADPDPASVGLPLPGVEVKIHEPGQTGDGEVHIRGVSVMKGYWQDEEATRLALHEGWFRSGDVGRIDHRGHLYITGRLKNLIISPGGKNISPEEIEAAALKSPVIAEIMVYGSTTASGSGEEVCARVHPDCDYLKAKGKWPLDSEAMLALVRREVEAATSHLAGYKKIVHYELTDVPFEKTSTHKIKRFKYRPAGHSR